MPEVGFLFLPYVDFKVIRLECFCVDADGEELLFGSVVIDGIEGSDVKGVAIDELKGLGQVNLFQIVEEGKGIYTDAGAAFVNNDITAAGAIAPRGIFVVVIPIRHGAVSKNMEGIPFDFPIQLAAANTSVWFLVIILYDGKVNRIVG